MLQLQLPRPMRGSPSLRLPLRLPARQGVRPLGRKGDQAPKLRPSPASAPRWKSGPPSETCDALFAHSLILVASALAASAHSVLFSQNLATVPRRRGGAVDHHVGTGDLSPSMFKAILRGAVCGTLAGEQLRSSWAGGCAVAERQCSDCRPEKDRGMGDEYSGTPKELISLSALIDALQDFIYKEIASLGDAKGTPWYTWKWTYLVSQRFIELSSESRLRSAGHLLLLCGGYEGG